MNYEIVNLEEKIFIGILERTGMNDSKCQEKIGGLWQRYMGEGICNSIRNNANDYCVGLYSDYEFDNLSYDVLIGREVTEAYDAEQFTVKRIPGGKYALFRIKGDVVKDVSKAWEEIWKMNLDRSFTGDFEEYISNVNGVAEINIYIALK